MDIKILRPMICSQLVSFSLLIIRQQEIVGQEKHEVRSVAFRLTKCPLGKLGLRGVSGLAGA